ncbi:MAG: hypothetical protein ACOYOS_04200 [Syntrophales bacterium]
MKPEETSILFMDDQIHDGTAIMVNMAVEALRQEGYNVTTTDKISVARDAFFNKYYKIFILDIDMSKVEDIYKNEGGSLVAAEYRALDNDAMVIMYSAMGTVEDWFKVANFHVYGYIFKGEDTPVDSLLKMVRKAALEERQMTLPTSQLSGRVLVGTTKATSLSSDQFTAIVKAAGDFTPDFCRYEEMAEKLSEANYAAALVVSNEFDTRPSNMELINRICSVQPEPHFVIACLGKEENQPSILHILNARPFRLINLLWDNPLEKITKAIADAARWYGGNETFEAKPEHVHKAAEDIDWDPMKKDFEDDMDVYSGEEEHHDDIH